MALHYEKGNNMESNRLILVLTRVGRDLPSGSFIVKTGAVCVTL